MLDSLWTKDVTSLQSHNIWHEVCLCKIQLLLVREESNIENAWSQQLLCPSHNLTQPSHNQTACRLVSPSRQYPFTLTEPSSRKQLTNEKELAWLFGCLFVQNAFSRHHKLWIHQKKNMAFVPLFFFLCFVLYDHQITILLYRQCYCINVDELWRTK